MAKKKKGILGAIANALLGNGGKKRKSTRSRRSASSKRTSSSKKSSPKSATKTPSKTATGKKKVYYSERTDVKAKKPLIQKIIAIFNKRIKQKQKVRPRNEFRFNHKEEHMNYVFGENDVDYKSVGLTTREATFGKKNMKLKNNPKTGDLSDKSHIRNGIISDRKESFSRKTAKNFEFSKEDMANVKSKIRHYKKEQKRIKKKIKK